MYSDAIIETYASTAWTNTSIPAQAVNPFGEVIINSASTIAISGVSS